MGLYSVIMTDPVIRQLVQERTLVRSFRDALLEATRLRTIVDEVEFKGDFGDSSTYSRRGYAKPSAKPLRPGEDANLITGSNEQWDVRPEPYGHSIDSHLPTSALALASLLMENMITIGTHAGESVARVIRAKAYQAVRRGRTNTIAAVAASVTVPVQYLNGFTHARKTDGSAVVYSPVGASNPLGVWIYDTDSSAYVARNVVGATPATSGDNFGPGTLTLNAAITCDAANYEVVSVNAPHIVRSGIGAGLKFGADPRGIESIVAGNLFRASDVKSMVGRLRSTNVKPFAGGLYRGYLNSTSELQLLSDPEMTGLMKEPGQQHMYRDLAIGECLGVLWFRAEDLPKIGNTDTDKEIDPLPFDMVNSGDGIEVHRPMVVGREFIEEHYIKPSTWIDANLMISKKGEFMLSAEGELDISVQNIACLVRPAMDRLGEKVATTWSYKADIVAGTDGVDADRGGDPAVIKRAIICEHGVP